MLQLMRKDIQISKCYLLLGIAAMGLAIYVIYVALEGFPLAFPVDFFSYMLIITASKADEKK